MVGRRYELCDDGESKLIRLIGLLVQKGWEIPGDTKLRYGDKLKTSSALKKMLYHRKISLEMVGESCEKSGNLGRKTWSLTENEQGKHDFSKKESKVYMQSDMSRDSKK